MPSKLKRAIGAVKDQTSISLAKVASNNASNLEVAVLKATTHDDVPMDERYVYEVVEFVSSSKVYAASCARAIGKRIGRTRNWIVALKSLMLVLRIFQDGDPYFPREILHAMKRGAKILNLTSFRDDSNSSPWDFTSFVRTFALYLDERLDCFLTGKLQRRCTYRDKVSPSARHRSRRQNDPVRDMKPAMLLDKISYWQRLLERAIATRPTGAAKSNRLVQISLYAIVQETFDLYKDISDGLALLLDSFFHLQYQNCVSAFQTCVKASKQFQELSAFYSLCKDIGVGRTSEYPSVRSISEELIETLQEFLKDQSSFPATTKAPRRPALPLPAPRHARSGRNDSYGSQSELSATAGFSGRTSELNSRCTSLEELISATGDGVSPAISIDLEAYSDQFEKLSQRDSTFAVSDTGSTRSLPASNSMADLVSLCDWPDEDDKQAHEEEQKEPELDPAQGRSHVQVKAIASSGRSLPNVNGNYNAFHEIPRHCSANVLRTNSFNAFQEDTTPSRVPEKSLHSNSFNACPGAASSPFVQLGKATRTSSLSAIDRATTPSAQASKTSRTNSFNDFFDVARLETQQLPFSAFPVAPTQSSQSTKASCPNSFSAFPDIPIPSSQAFSAFDAFPKTTTPSVRSSMAKRSNSFNAFFDDATHLQFNAFPESTMPTTQSSHDLNSFNGFPYTETPSIQPLSDVAGNYTSSQEHGPDQPPRGFISGYPDQSRTEKSGEQEDYSRSSWELALVVTAPQPEQSSKNISSLDIFEFDSPCNQPKMSATDYNPFLQDQIELPTMSNQDLKVVPCSNIQPTFSARNSQAPEAAFEATPTFSAQQPNNMDDNDPFALGSTAFTSEHVFFNSTSTQQNLFQQQQLWLQNQNKIIAKHMAR